MLILAAVISINLYHSSNLGSVVGDTVHVRSMGSISCSHWDTLKGVPISDGRKAVTLNFVLGYLTGRSSMSRRRDTLATTDEVSVAAWLDTYCANNPTEDLTRASMALEASRVEQGDHL